jgi:hypothetical protein
MPKKYKVIEDTMKTATAAPKPTKEVSAKKSQSQKMQTDRLANKRADSDTPKNNNAVFSAKPEPNRGTGTDRHPAVARAHVTRPTMETRETEYTANKELTGTHKLATIRNAMQKKSGMSDYYSHNDKSTKKSVKEDAGAVSVGSGAVAGITDPTTNYAFQDLKKKQKAAMVRRKKPVGEEFAAGIGNTQAPADSKKSDKKSLSSFKKKGTKASSPPVSGTGNTDTTQPIGGE